MPPAYNCRSDTYEIASRLAQLRSGTTDSPKGGDSVRPSADPEACLGELVSLWTAASADALHQVLVLHPYRRQSADAFEPWPY